MTYVWIVDTVPGTSTCTCYGSLLISSVMYWSTVVLRSTKVLAYRTGFSFYIILVLYLHRIYSTSEVGARYGHMSYGCHTSPIHTMCITGLCHTVQDAGV